MVAEPRRSRRKERKEETRAELIAAAGKVFADRGFHAASMDQIAAEAGYTTGAIYGHFTGKDDLFLAVSEQYAATRARELGEIHERAEGPLPERARAYADHWMARFRRDPGFMVLSLEFLVHAWRNPELREEFGARIGALRLTVARLIEEAAEDEGVELPLPPEELATVLRELGVGLALAKLADPDAFRDELYGDFVEAFFEQLPERRAAAGGRRRRAR